MDTIDLNLRLSPHFTLREFTLSGTAIAHNIGNTPHKEHVERLKALCENVLEPLRRRFGVIRITSGYRCSELNARVGGARRPSTCAARRRTSTCRASQEP